MKFRDLMAPDTDPTDEELELVAREALQIVREREVEFRKRIAALLTEAAVEAEKNRLKPKRQSENKSTLP